MPKRGRPKGKNKTYPMRLNPQTYEQLHDLAASTGQTLGTTVQHLIGHGGPWVIAWNNMSTGILSDNPSIEEKTSGILAEVFRLRQELGAVTLQSTEGEVLSPTTGGASGRRRKRRAASGEGAGKEDQ